MYDPNYSAAIDTYLEEISSLEDCLDAAQERADEWMRLGVNLFWALHETDNTVANSIWWDEPTLQEEILGKYFEDEPGKCIWEIKVDGNSFCKLLGRETACHVIGCEKDA